MLTDAQMHARMRMGWRGGRPFTVCGDNSLPIATANVRAWLPAVCERRGIKVVCDAGAGDLKWRDGMDWTVTYRAFDLIPRHPSVRAIDITRDVLPPCDAVLCRMVFNHLDEDRIVAALALFRQSARYLFATQFDGGRGLRPDLRPWLGEPLESVRDGLDDECRLALWDIRSRTGCP